VGALKPGRRKLTAREVAQRYGISERHVRRAIAEPRDDFEARARARQAQALALIESGLTYQQAADQMGITRGTAAGLVHRARARRREESAA
jgi:predicted DNA-binding protein (UPF0251 family)